MAAYQYLDLPVDASVVTIRALLIARGNICDTVAARAMMCTAEPEPQAVS